ncbi:MAG: prephenate dehydrogenase/arogenate dehydrogenase family protein [bacterium]
MSFKKISIIGLGLIGGSMAAALRRKQVVGHIVGIDDGHVIAEGLSRDLINEGYRREDIQKGVIDVDLIILATPIKVTLMQLPNVAKQVKPGTLITDVGSTKVKIVNTASKYLPKDVYFLGGHPMTGSEKRGLEYADPFLFENAVYVLTENKSIPNKLIEKFVEMIEAIGAKVIFLPAKLHDEIAAVVSQLPQILAVTLMHYASNLNKKNSLYLKLAAGGFRDMTRVASSPFHIWTDICRTNEDNIKEAIDQFMEELKTIKELLSDSKLKPIFNDAARNRLSIPKDTRGFLRPHFNISIVVEDRPGVIANISTILASENINIKDIEILKVREGEAGTLRLAFESEAEREKAMQLLMKNRFQVSKRE